ncbi:MAG: helix-turn-helix domain-containing protein [Acidimicrobiia bacterium]|nr:helix-turn-helix domain-containing protein [Acidimicrobiia bacterium]
MRMTDTTGEHQIIRLAATAVPSLAACRLVGVYLLDDGWQHAPDEIAERHVLVEVETQLAVVSNAGGAIAAGQDAWGWAFPLRSLGGHLGFLTLSADLEPASGQQFLLRVLAQQTGVALANARLHARQRAQAAELLATNTRLAETVEALERSTAIHDRLTRTATAGEGQDGIAQAVHELTGFAVAVEDRYGNLRAWAGPGRPEEYPKDPPDQREAFILRARDTEGPIRHQGRLLALACPRDDIVGVLALIDPEQRAEGEARLALEHGATVLAMELARLASIAEVELRLSRDLVDDLLSGLDEASAVTRAEALGYDLERPHRVLVVEVVPEVEDRLELFNAVRRSARDLGVGSLLGRRGQTVVVLSDTERPWEQLRSSISRELRGARCRLGVGGVCDNVSDVPRSHREAMMALRVLAVVGGSDRAIAFDELGVYRLLAGIEDLTEVERFAHTWLGALIAYDENKESSELVTTLGEYLDRGGNYDATAHALAVHRSTLKYRLQRIRDITGHDLSLPDTQFNLQLALRAYRTTQVVRHWPN